MRTLLLTAAFAVLGCSPALADTLFFLQGATLTNGTTASGSIGINTATGTVDFADILSTQGGSQYTFTTVSGQQNNFDPNYPQVTFKVSDATGEYFLFNIPDANLINYTGSSVCSISANCGGFVSGFVSAGGAGIALQTGSLAQTPEPSSLALLSTGLLGLAGVARRRLWPKG